MTGFSENVKKTYFFQLKTLIIGMMIILVVWFAGAFILDQRQAFLPGKTSEGHLLFEVSCNSCHEGFKPVTNEACMRCHEPEMATDVHGEKKFRDPRWAELLNNIDVLTCTACHQEHVHIFARGVNLKPDLCMSCHEGVIAGDIPSHKGFERDGCWTAGCHNFHDHRSISTGFLGRNLNQPRLLPKPELPILTVTATVEKAPPPDLSKEFLK